MEDKFGEFEKWHESPEEEGGTLGVGTLAHATASANRDSILRFGLDWSRMGAAPGIAGSRGPELDAVFLDYIERIGFFTRMSRQPCDVWGVDVEGLWIERYEGWLIHRSRIPPSRLHLLAQDLPPGHEWEEWAAD